MANNSDPRELENNSWVIASSEAVPVEDLGPEAVEAENEQVKAEPQAPLSDRKLPDKQLESEESRPKDPEVAPSSSSGATSAPGPAKTPESVLLEKEPSLSSTEEAASKRETESGSLPDTQVPLLIHKAGPLEEPTNTSSDDGSGDRDVEGLRRRKGRDTHLAGPGAPHNRRGELVGGEDSILPGTTWLLGLLAIFGVGILAFSGVVFEVEEGPVDIRSSWPSADGEEPHLSSAGKDWPAELSPEAAGEGKLPRAKEVPPSVAPSDTQSLDTMGHLLDKLAKENQEIRLMQAELQAQKEELQSMLRKTEGEALEFTTQQQNLAMENAQLSEALRRETSALVAAQTELRLVQEKLQSLGEMSDAKPQQPPEEKRRDKAEQPEAEVRRLRLLLASVRQDLARASQQAPPGEGSKWLQKMLGDVQQRLSQELGHPEVGRSARPSWREGHKAKRGKEKTWHKRFESPDDQRLEHHKEHRFLHKPPTVPADGPQRPRKHGTRDGKPAKDSGHRHAARKVKKPTEPSALWEMLSQHHYRGPQGCTGITECAQQEGLLPVQKTGFLPLMQSYLARLGWAEHYGGLAAALDPFFDHSGVFAHDRLSFVDFLDEIEDALEDLAEILGGSEEQVDDFEAVVLQQLGSAPGGRFSQRNGAQRSPKERNRDAHHPHHKHGWEGAGRAHG